MFKKKGKTWYLIFDGQFCEINLNSATLTTLAVQLLAGENPNLSSARCVVSALPSVLCQPSATPQLSGHPRLQESRVGSLLCFFAVFQPPTPRFGFACGCAHTGMGSVAGGGKPGWQAQAGSVGVYSRVALTLGGRRGVRAGGGAGWQGLLGAGHRPQPGRR